LKIGDLVVHVDNGIGRFVGLKRLGLAPGLDPQEFMELRYAGDDKLFVPLERLDLVQKYTGGAAPALDKLGGTTWEKAKTRVKKAMRDMAEELLKLYAARKAVVGHAFSPDSHWQEEFGDAFEYDLTYRSADGDCRHPQGHGVDDADGSSCSAAMSATARPKSRWRAGVQGGDRRQAGRVPGADDDPRVSACPDAERAVRRLPGEDRHDQPVPIKQEQKDLLSQLAPVRSTSSSARTGCCRRTSSSAISACSSSTRSSASASRTRRRSSSSARKSTCLTMTATPIPRTLNMSLVGIRDMSVIETPPRDRLSIQTQVVKFDADVISRAIRTEIERGGQVYFVHNRVESIYSMGNLITKLVPDVKIGIGHGQMPEDELERVMVDFVAHKFDVLLATTIVENGLDIPNANTIVINRADRYGLAQLYQLRGRVGRSDRRAYAYLLIPAEQTLSADRPVAGWRRFASSATWAADFASPRSTWRSAEPAISSAGQQSGHIEAVGFDMYMKLLESTIRELKGEDMEDERRAPS
jgi:transcription-repair coupling factor (superfamily II helicase)